MGNGGKDEKGMGKGWGWWRRITLYSTTDIERMAWYTQKGRTACGEDDESPRDTAHTLSL
jgi:hypothetical protein